MAPGGLRSFTIVGADKKWQAAAARIEGDVVIEGSPEVAQPVAGRHGLANHPDGNRFHGAGLRVMPFRTDRWP